MKTKSLTLVSTWALLALAIFAVLAMSAPPALAGRGSSPEAIRQAIAAGAYDSIAAELERAERLVCPACVPMVRPLLDHPDERIRRVAAWWLARRGLASDLFVEAAYRLAQPDSVKARNGAAVLGSLRNRRGVAPLGAALNNPVFDADARSAMARALGRIGDPGAAAALAQAMGDPQAAVRGAAVAALRELTGKWDPAPALALLGDADETVRAESIYTLGAARGRALEGARGHELVSALLTRLQEDPSPSVRKKAAWALGEIGAPAPQASAALGRAAREDRDPAVRSLAGAAVSRLRP